MNKILTKISKLLLGFAMAAGVGVTLASSKGISRVNADAGSYVVDFSQTYSGVNAKADVNAGDLYQTTSDFDSSKTFNYINCYSGSGYIMLGSKEKKGTAMFSNHTAVPGNISSIVITKGGSSSASAQYYVCTSATEITTNDGAGTAQSTGKNSYTYNVPSGNSHTYFAVYSTNTSYNGQIATITVYYTTGGGESDPVLQSIAVSNEKTSYVVGEEFVKPTVTATYDQGAPQDVTADATFTGYDLTSAGNYTVTVSYGGKTTTFDIAVSEPEPVGDALYSCDFTTLETFSYTQDKEITLNEKTWTASVAQVNGGVFYLGCNSTHAAKGILNDNSNFSDVVTALASEDSTYNSNKSTAHAYALRFANSYSNVGKIQLDWAGANNIIQVYLFGNQGSGLVCLAHVQAENGSTASGSISWTASGYGEEFTSIVAVARPGATGTTAASKTIRFTTFNIFEGESETVDPTKKNMVIKESGVAADGQSYVYSSTTGAYTFESYEESTKVSGVTWSSSDESVATINSSTGALTIVAPGSTTISATADGYNDASAAITITKGTVSSVVISGSMTKTSYYVGESWSNGGLTATANYSSGWHEDVSESATWNYNPASPALNVDSVSVSATFNSVTSGSSAQSVSVSKANPLQVFYTKSSGASVDVYGYYVGFLDGTGPVIMDGAYGAVIYNKTADVSGYTAGETILHVTGSVSIYKGLYEIGSATISVASGSFDTPETPVVYATTGNETAEYAARLTTVTGTPSLVSGSFDSAAGTADITLSFAVGTKAVQVFYKKAAQTADADAFVAIKDAVANSSEITIKGFTGWFEGFQVQMNGYIPAAESYTAEEFAQDLLDQTDAVCEEYDGKANNHDALEAIWTNLASNDKYPSLPSAEKAKLADANRDESGTVVEQAMARYDYLTGKYSLSNFINGRTPVVFANPVITTNNVNNSSSTIIIVVVALTSITSMGILLVIKRKRSLMK